jgi:hypothetical protein
MFDFRCHSELKQLTNTRVLMYSSLLTTCSINNGKTLRRHGYGFDPQQVAVRLTVWVLPFTQSASLTSLTVTSVKAVY